MVLRRKAEKKQNSRQQFRRYFYFSLVSSFSSSVLYKTRQLPSQTLSPHHSFSGESQPGFQIPAQPPAVPEVEAAGLVEAPAVVWY